MAKELPYFRFTSQEWQNGLISLESYHLKGLFIDICAYYWVQNCKVTSVMLRKKFQCKIELKQLENAKVFKVTKNGQVKISFLDEQLKSLSNARKVRQLAGAKGGKQKSSNAKAKLKQSSSYKDKDKDKDKDKERKNKETVEHWNNNIDANGFVIIKEDDNRP
jgi:hypothetical protein